MYDKAARDARAVYLSLALTAPFSLISVPRTLFVLKRARVQPLVAAAV